MFRKNTLKRTLKLLVVLGLLALTASVALAQDGAQPSRNEVSRPLPPQIESLKLDTPAHLSGAEAAFRLAPELRTSEVFLRTAGKIRATLPHEETRT